MTESARAELVGRLRDLVVTRSAPHTVRVAVDGITASGKTTLAGELADAIAATGRPVIRVTMDGYHHPRERRHRQGRLSADGYYEDAYDLDSFADLVLRPLGPGGDGCYTPAVIDLATDTCLTPEPVVAPAGGWLIVDGSFLQRRELDGLWDVVVWVETSFEAARRRGVARDEELLGGADATEAAFDQRYHAAARRYIDEADPAMRADIVFVNDDPARPELRIRGPEPG